MATWTWPIMDGARPIGTRVTDVVDGDTVSALLVEDCAFGNQLTHRVRLRLARINAAKGPTGNGTAATMYLLKLLDLSHDRPPAEIRELVTLKPYKYGGPAGDYRGDVVGGPKGYGGEYLVEIELEDGTNVSDAMVASGHAVYWDGLGPRPADELAHP